MTMGGDRLIMGDFNRTPAQQLVARVLASGAWHLADEVDGSSNHATRRDPRGDGRHIDYGIHSSKGVIKRRHQWEGYADHDVVAYDIEMEPLPPT